MDGVRYSFNRSAPEEEKGIERRRLWALRLTELGRTGVMEIILCLSVSCIAVCRDSEY